jgi:hypothetical protein
MSGATADLMSQEMRQRYGLDRNPWPSRIISGLVLLGFAGILVFFAMRLTAAPITPRLLLWQQLADDRLDITFDVNKPAGMAVSCVLRAQDADRTDIGYATTELDAAPGYQQATYQMRVIAPAAYVEILGCGPTGEPLRVPPAAFPPGVAAPTQPWSAG